MVSINLGFKDFLTLNFWRAVLAEFVGMVFFLLGVSLVCNGWQTGIDRSANNLEIGLGIGLSITTSAVLVGHVSGGHLNPAVSLGMIFAGKISVAQGLFYIPAQMVGGIVGSSLAYALTPKAERDLSNLGAVSLQNGVSVGQGFGCELLFTLVLVLFVLMITDPNLKTPTYSAVLGIGICIWVIHLFLVPMTGCGINPARAFGPAVVMRKWKDHWVYWIGPIVAAPIAALLYKFVFYHPKAEEEKASEEPEAEAMKNLGEA